MQPSVADVRAASCPYIAQGAARHLSSAGFAAGAADADVGGDAAGSVERGSGGAAPGIALGVPAVGVARRSSQAPSATSARTMVDRNSTHRSLAEVVRLGDAKTNVGWLHPNVIGRECARDEDQDRSHPHVGTRGDDDDRLRCRNRGRRGRHAGRHLTRRPCRNGDPRPFTDREAEAAPLERMRFLGM